MSSLSLKAKTTKNMTILILFCGVSVLLQSCRSSLLFSPAINAPSAPLTASQSQIYGGATMLVETRPNIVKNFNQVGSELGVRYGFSNRVSAQAKWWNTLEGDLDIWGASG